MHGNKCQMRCMKALEYRGSHENIRKYDAEVKKALDFPALRSHDVHTGGGPWKL